MYSQNHWRSAKLKRLARRAMSWPFTSTEGRYLKLWNQIVISADPDAP
jgi:hypothetical protein